MIGDVVHEDSDTKSDLLAAGLRLVEETQMRPTEALSPQRFVERKGLPRHFTFAGARLLRRGNKVSILTLADAAHPLTGAILATQFRGKHPGTYEHVGVAAAITITLAGPMHFDQAWMAWPQERAALFGIGYSDLKEDKRRLGPKERRRLSELGDIALGPMFAATMGRLYLPPFVKTKWPGSGPRTPPARCGAPRRVNRKSHDIVAIISE